MKNKKIMLAFIIGVLLSGTSVYAATTYLASNVTYKETTVENALNELYDKSIKLDEENIFFNYFKHGYNSTSKKVSLDLKKGKYICNISGALGYLSTNSISTYVDGNGLESNVTGCSSIKSLKFSTIHQTANTKDDSRYETIGHIYGNFICDVDADTQISYEFVGMSQSTVPVTFILSCNKIT